MESPVGLLTLPTELLVYIISFLSLIYDRIKLRYVSSWLKCVVEGTPLLWREFVWPYYCNSPEECCVKEVLKVCGQHIKVLSFYQSRASSTLVDMLQCCSNVQHLHLPSTKLDPDQLKKTIFHMRCLKTLQLMVVSDVKHVLLYTGQLKELTILSHPLVDYGLKELFKHWAELEFRPSGFNVIINMFSLSFKNIITEFFDYVATQLTNSASTIHTANFRAYNRSSSKVPFNFSCTFPYFQLQFKASGKVTTPHVHLSNFGILGLNNDAALMTDCQYDGRTMYIVRYQFDDDIVNKLNFLPITRCCNLSCVTHFDLTNCFSLHSYHLEQLAIVCPNIQGLSLKNCSFSLEILQGLREIDSHCKNLKGLYLLGLHLCKDLFASPVQNHIIQLWEILWDMNLIHLAVELCVLRSEPANKENLYQKCWTIQGIQCGLGCYSINSEDIKFLSYFPSLNFYYSPCSISKIPSNIVQNVITNCKELRCAYFSDILVPLSLGLAYNRNLQLQFYIYSPGTDVPDDFMTSVSAHGGLIHVTLSVRSLTVEGLTSLMRNSPKLTALNLGVFKEDMIKNTNKLRKIASSRFANSYFTFLSPSYWDCVSRYEQDKELFPLW